MRNRLSKLFSMIGKVIGAVWQFVIGTIFTIVIIVMILNSFGFHIGSTGYNIYDDFQDVERY